MTAKHLWSVILIVVLSLALAAPARAESLNTAAAEIIIGIVAVSVVLTFVVAATVVHYSRKRTITGCVISGVNGMTITDEKDKQTYALSGNTAGIKAGDRVKVHGKRVKLQDNGTTRSWATKDIGEDFGACKP